MNIVCSGGRYQIYGEELRTYDRLPAGYYGVSFNPMSGFSLVSITDLEVKEDKVYGDRYKKVEKALRSFEASDRNFGIILSGKKGIGKSLFAKMLASEGIKKGYPVIVVSAAVGGIAGFISSIQQEVIVIFDEFDKTFSNGRDDEDDSERSSIQDELLPLFDGIDSGKKMFVITCNELYKISSYFKNRPGRFHYHFHLGNPNAEEIREYLIDKLNPDFYSQIDGVVRLSAISDVNYDILRALAFELNQGYELNECLEDMNITMEEDIRTEITIILSDGIGYYGIFNFDLYDKNEQRTGELFSNEAPKNGGRRDSIRACIPSAAIVVNRSGELMVDKNKINVYYRSSFDPKECECVNSTENIDIVDVKIKKIPSYGEEEIRRFTGGVL